MSRTIPVLRVFDYDKAVSYYIDWLGFKIDHEIRPEEGRFYIEISRDDIALHLIQHPDDGTRGSWVLVCEFQGLVPYWKLLPMGAPYTRPPLKQVPGEPNTLAITLMDPFFNRLEIREKMR